MGIFDMFKKKNINKNNSNVNNSVASNEISETNQREIVRKKYTYKGKNYLTNDGIGEEISRFEKEIGTIPEQLKKFWINDGYGFIAEHEDGVPVQRLLSPYEIIDIINGQWIPDIEYYNGIKDKGFVIMEYDMNNYFWIGKTKDNQGKIFWLDSEICGSFNELIKKLENDEDVLK